jgi:hypothetical protein
MNGKGLAGLGSLCAALAWLGVGLAEDTAARTEPTTNTGPATKEESSSVTAADRAKPVSAAESARQSCVRQCEIDNGYCNSEVRQARQECSRNAASNGRDPMTMRNNDYAYFCSYFRNPSYRGPGNFSARFAQHYDMCIDVIQQNIASMRYDCYRNERDAQNICRTELRQCQAACQ